MRDEELDEEFGDQELEYAAEEPGSGFGTFVLGALFGAGVALLLTARTGRETQAEIARLLGGVRERAGGPVQGARESVARWAGEATGTVSGRLDEVRAAVDDRLDRVRGAVDEGRMAASHARVELRRRVDEARASYRAHRGPAPAGPRVVSAEAPADGAPGDVVITETVVERDAGDLAG
ncbi:MAG TPA: YtxH domain-containing protein [Longimicrobium sp.]|nr:YtxH domain-containing protein [Longimicrobium sp.]